MCRVLYRVENTKINTVILALIDFVERRHKNIYLALKIFPVILTAETSPTCFGRRSSSDSAEERN